MANGAGSIDLLLLSQHYYPQVFLHKIQNSTVCELYLGAGTKGLGDRGDVVLVCGHGFIVSIKFAI